jgi:hypothetical protein
MRADILNRLAARAGLLLISEREYPVLRERLTDFMQDRGAVGVILRDYDQEGLDEAARRYWGSRLEPNASRLEDLVTSVLLGVLASFVANVVTEMWKRERDVFGNKLENNDIQSLHGLANRLPARREELALVLGLYAAKQQGSGVADGDIARRLYEMVTIGRSITEATQDQPGLITSVKDPLEFGEAVCRGVVMTEFAPTDPLNVNAFSAERSGLPLSERQAFGEIIVLNEAEIEDNRAKLRAALSKRQLHPSHWPSDSTFATTTSPKIIVSSESILSQLLATGSGDLIGKAVGIVTLDGSMTSHSAVFARSVRQAAIASDLADIDLERIKFAVIQADRLLLYYTRPNLTAEAFDSLIARTRRYGAA